MIKSLFSGVSGLKAHNQRMDVIGNNIANVNSTAYKANNVTFKDVFYQSKSTSSSGTATSGGVNSKQVGYGVKLGTIGQVMTQSGLTYSDSVYDCALQGEGFFQVMDNAGNIFYTRNGVFDIDDNGNFRDANGYIVLGVSGDPTGMAPSQNRISIQVPSVDNSVSSVTKATDEYSVTFQASGFGEAGNMSVTIQHSTSPFATFSNGNLNVFMDLNAEFADDAEFELAFNEALNAGGIDIPGILPIDIIFAGDTSDVSAKNASNVMNLAGGNNLTFEMFRAGEFGNKFEVNMVSTGAANSGIFAQWNGDVLTVNVPNDPTIPFTAQDIQVAINRAAGMTEVEPATTPPTFVDGTGILDKRIVVTAANATTAITETTDLNSDDFIADMTEKGMLRVSLNGGKDNLFADMAKNLGTIRLDGGHLFEAQSHDNLDSVFIDDKGVIYGEHAILGTLLLGRIDLVTFKNPGGLDRVGTSYWKESLASGEATVKNAGEDGAASIISGALEMSNVDLSQEFSDMIITQRGFQANSRIITVSDTMLEELVNLKR